MDAALVLDGDAAQGVVLALGVAGPVVGHQDPGQRGVAVEDDAEHVERLALVPVVGGVDVHDARDVGVGVGRGDLEPDAAVEGHREQVVDGVQLVAGVAGVVHAADTGAELEAQGRVVAQGAGHDGQVFSADVEGDLAAVDDHAVDGDRRLERVGHVVVPAAVGALGGTGEYDGRDQAAVAAGVAGALGAEHAASYADRLVDLRVGGDDVGGGVLGLVAVAGRARRLSLTAAGPSGRWSAGP